jgi:hypothetical protein
MEIRLEAAEGCKMPLGTYVAVKVGDALKQGRYEPTRSYMFPNVKKRHHAKIDIFKHVGTSAIVVSPESGSRVSEVSITSCDPNTEDLRMKVDMKPNAATTGNVAKNESAKVAKSAARDQATAYLGKHKIEEKLSACMKALLQERPEDPFEYICSFFRGAPKSTETSAAVEQGKKQAQNSGRKPAAQPVPPKEAPVDPAPIRQALVQASNDGSLLGLLNGEDTAPTPANPKAVATDRMEQVRLKARQSLTSAAMSGELQRQLQDLFPDFRTLCASARAALTEASADGSLSSVLREAISNEHRSVELSTQGLQVSDTVNVLREKASATLTAASQDGRLIQALGAGGEDIPISQQRPNGPQAQHQNVVQASDEDLRKACSVLTGNKDAVVLHDVEAAERNKVSQINNLRMKSCRALIKASDSGVLARILYDAEQAPKHTMATRASDGMPVQAVAGNGDGRLDVLGPSVDVGTQARNLITESCLRVVASAKDAKLSEINELSKRTGNDLANASDNGLLLKALSQEAPHKDGVP